MFWVMLLMIPAALFMGCLRACEKGHEQTARYPPSPSSTTATPEYVSALIFIAIFASSAVGYEMVQGHGTRRWKSRL